MTDLPDPPKPSKKPLYTRPKFIASMIASVIFLILIFQNWEDVSINIFFMVDKKVPGSLLYIIFSLIGFIVGWLLKRPKTHAKSTK
jgi:uncharacterized integral membrane protein